MFMNPHNPYPWWDALPVSGAVVDWVGFAVPRIAVAGVIVGVAAFFISRSTEPARRMHYACIAVGMVHSFVICFVVMPGIVE